MALAKPKKQTLFASFCNNIINHETKWCFFIPCSLYDAKHIDLKKWGYCQVLHIDVRSSTWTKLWSLNAIHASSWDICIHFATWGGYCIALPKPRSNTILTPYCDNILNHGTNEGIVELITLMVKGNETIFKMRVLQLHIKTLSKGL
jgi:hypothetical protein